MKDINFVRKIAWSFYYTTGIPYKELFSEASLAYFEFFHTKKRNWYKEELPASELTYVKIFIESRLIEFCRQEEKNNHISIDTEAVRSVFNSLFTKPVIEDNNWEAFSNDVKKILKVSLTEDVLEIVKVIFSSPKEFADLTIPYARVKIKEKMEEKGWNKWAVQEAIRKTRIVVNSIPEGEISIPKMNTY